MLKELDDYDWSAVFHFAGGADVQADMTGKPEGVHVPADEGEYVPFSREDVATVIAMHIDPPEDQRENYFDGTYSIVCRLKDGRYAYLEAWHDTSGWG